jgi:VIT1/CCC1 family predicted Fe2+/Mn2+ transporter
MNKQSPSQLTHGILDPDRVETGGTRNAHTEHHFTASDSVRDVVIGMSDGLTVPFALAAGLSGAVSASRLVVTAGLAEVVAGSIAMGLGGYLAARSEAEHYANEVRRERLEIVTRPEAERTEVCEVLERFGLTPEESDRVARTLSMRPDAWIDFMMRFELGLEEPDPRRALRSALTIAVSYVIGGLVPLMPYMFTVTASAALVPSITVTLMALLLFGFVKGRFTGSIPWRSAVQTAVIGSLAAAAAFGIARAIS